MRALVLMVVLTQVAGCSGYVTTRSSGYGLPAPLAGVGVTTTALVQRTVLCPGEEEGVVRVTVGPGHERYVYTCWY